SFEDAQRMLREARENVFYGYDSIKEQYKSAEFHEKIKNRARSYGLYYNQNSTFSRSEQVSMASADRNILSIHRAFDVGFGAMNIGMGFLPGNKLSNAAGMGSIAAGVAGFGGTAGFLGRASTATNPYLLAGMVAMEAARYGTQEAILDPLVNTRMYQQSAFLNSRQILGGTQTNNPTGGLSSNKSFELGRYANQLQRNNRHFISPEDMNIFVQEASTMPQLQYAGNMDQVMKNMESAIKIMTNISRIFKGKNGREIAESLRQFGEMGMSLNQSESAFFGAQRMGGLLNVDPSRIMQSGYMSTEMSRQSGLAKSMLYATG